MDSATKKVHDVIHEYLDDIHGRSHIPLSQELVDNLQAVADGIQRGEAEAREDLSPGEREAAQASAGLYEEVALEPTDGLSPGAREARELSHGVN